MYFNPQGLEKLNDTSTKMYFNEDVFQWYIHQGVFQPTGFGEVKCYVNQDVISTNRFGEVKCYVNQDVFQTTGFGEFKWYAELIHQSRCISTHRVWKT